MHSTRIATFLLGAWIGCCIFLDVIAIDNLRLAKGILNAATPPAVEIIQRAGREQAALLLRYFAVEQYRYYFSAWELIQIPGALTLAGVLYVATEKRTTPLILCGLMLTMVLFQLAIHPEITYRGREADFPPGNQALAIQARVWALNEIWIGTELVKLLFGGLLASYMFAYKSRRRRRGADDAFADEKLSRLRESV